MSLIAVVSFFTVLVDEPVTDTGWRALLETEQGLHQATDILEKYGIGSETDLSELEQDDFSELESESRALGCKEAEALMSS